MKDDARLSAYGLPIGDSPVRPGLIEELWAHDMSRRYSSQPMVFMRSFLDLYPELRDDYDVPELFREEQDMLNALPHKARLDWHWLIIAPTRSGSYWHIDPVNTTAWNALVSGKKRWATYPPETYYVPGMRHNDLRKQAYGDKEGVDNPYLWFSQTLPYIKPQLKPQECIQQPGDVIFMPEGWWHAVLNVEDTVAVTQNFLRKSARRNTVQLLRQSDHPQTLKALAMKYGDTYPGLFEERDTMDQERLTSDDLKDMAGKIHMVEKLKRLGKSEKELQELMQNKRK
ncbi:uncharacterized protein LOC135497408 [Lineus longissimus]|uniref:uncharacterized protein LOC135497408 n=1 Tax=Lineus longissimus TaxID=88925 RepID=UPI002B4E231F